MAMAIPSATSDEALLERMLAGDAAAFESLYERRHPGIFRFALRMSGSDAIAEDITQEVFVALIHDGAKFDATRGTVAGYLFGMARHRILNRMQRERIFVAIADDDDGPGDDATDSAGDPLADLIRSRTIESVRQAVLTLPVHYREAVVLCDLHEMNYAEAATILGCAVGTVRSRLHRARNLLVERLRALAPSRHDQMSSENAL